MIAFARGTSLENSFVSVSDALGNAVDGVSANIVASGAASWLVSNKAAGDSILCLNVNTNATTSSSPITYTLEIEGLDDAWNFHGIKFRSVALNSAGNWQGATEIRHCNFVCSNGHDNANLVELATITDESIMVAGGAPKEITFDVEQLSPYGGKLVVRLLLYKGTNNNGCFYGLTGISLKGSIDDTGTAIEAVEDTKETNTASGVYDLSGRKAVAPSKGILIVDGAKKVLK